MRQSRNRLRRLQADQLLRDRWYPIDVIAPPPKVHPHIAAIGPTEARKCLRERSNAEINIAEEPTTGIAGCCARAASGHAAVLPSPAMNSRRRIADLQADRNKSSAIKVAGKPSRTAGPAAMSLAGPWPTRPIRFRAGPLIGAHRARARQPVKAVLAPAFDP